MTDMNSGSSPLTVDTAFRSDIHMQLLYQGRDRALIGP